MVRVLGEIRVLVPARIRRVVAIRHLHEAHARLAQPPRHETLPPEIIRVLLSDAVERKRRRRFRRDVQYARRIVLHPPRQFVRVNHRLQLTVTRLTNRLLRVHRLNQIELPPLRHRVEARVADIANAQLLRRLPRRADGRALIDRREEGIAEIPRTAIPQRRCHRDEARQVCVLRAQPVIHPRAHARAHERRGAAMQEERRRSMRHALGVQRMDETQIIHMPRHLGKEFAHPASAVPVLTKLPRRLHHALVRAAIAGVRHRARIIERQLLPVVLFQAWLVIERVDLTRPALHEEEDDALGPRREMRCPRRQRIHPHRIRRRHARERQIAKPARQRLQRLPAAQLRWCEKRVHLCA